MNPEQNQKTNNEEQKETLKNERVPIKSLRTFQGDVQEAISKNKYSATTVLVSEQKRKIERPEIADLQKKSEVKNKTYLVLGTTFILLGIISFLALYIINPNDGININQNPKTLVTFSDERNISDTELNRENLINLITENKQSWGSTVNSVLYINTSSEKQEGSIEKVVSIIGPNMLPSLQRSFGKDYMLGIYSFDTNETFIILTVDDFPLAYSGMLKWESDMAYDLDGFFDILNENFDESSNVFIDETAKNRDMRILKDKNGNPLVLYSFIDRQTLVITRNEGILSAIAGKIVLNRQVK